MTKEQFWNVIDQIKGKDEPEQAIAELLRNLTVSELISYQEHCNRPATPCGVRGAAGSCMLHGASEPADC